VKQDDIETEEQIIENQGRGLVTRVFSLSVKSKDAPRTPVSLVSFEDHSFAVVHERKALWAYVHVFFLATFFLAHVEVLSGERKPWLRLLMPVSLNCQQVPLQPRATQLFSLG